MQFHGVQRTWNPGKPRKNQGLLTDLKKWVNFADATGLFFRLNIEYYIVVVICSLNSQRTSGYFFKVQDFVLPLIGKIQPKLGLEKHKKFVQENVEKSGNKKSEF